MIFSINNNISALSAFEQKMQVIADNVANVNTEGFKKSRAILKEGPVGDVHVDIERIDTPGRPEFETRDGRIIERELSNVDLIEEIPQTILTQRGFEANLTLLKTKDEMLGSLIDTMA
jgi:flagellar basal body rod protein FlgG